MSEKGSAHWDNEQEKASPQIEEEIHALLDGDLKEIALGFIAYLRANQMAPRQWFGPNYWRIPYGQTYLCGMHLKKDMWRFWFFSGDYSGEFDKGFMQAVQAGVKSCRSCVDDCPKGKDMTVFGAVFSNACFQFPVQFENPDVSTLEYIKVLLEHWKKVGPHSDSWHCH